MPWEEDSFEIYDLSYEDLDDYLAEQFGDYDFTIEVRPPQVSFSSSRIYMAQQSYDMWLFWIPRKLTPVNR
jgi:hypothetical protein